jgi:hypothetical protein
MASRWEKEDCQPEQLTRPAKLREIVDLGLLVYPPEGLKRFLQTPLPVFGGRSGFELIQLASSHRLI